MADPYQFYRLRQQYAQDQGMQNLIGPLEHRDFMQEVTKQDPFMGALLATAAPFYTAMKALGVNVGDDKSSLTSQPSMDEVFGAWTGFARGLRG